LHGGFLVVLLLLLQQPHPHLPAILHQPEQLEQASILTDPSHAVFQDIDAVLSNQVMLRPLPSLLQQQQLLLQLPSFSLCLIASLYQEAVISVHRASFAASRPISVALHVAAERASFSAQSQRRDSDALLWGGSQQLQGDMWHMVAERVLHVLLEWSMAGPYGLFVFFL